MCCRYSCQNGHAILAQVFPLLTDMCRNSLCLDFAIMTAMEATSPLASESATLDSISLVDAASSTGEDFLMLDTPRLDDAQPPEEPALGEIDRLSSRSSKTSWPRWAWRTNRLPQRKPRAPSRLLGLSQPPSLSQRGPPSPSC